MWDQEAFRVEFASSGVSPNTVNTYCSFLNRIDQAIGGLNEAITKNGAEHVVTWGNQTESEPFATYRSHSKSVLKRYLRYRLDKASGADSSDEDVSLVSTSEPQIDANFKVEREMQAQVRQQIGQIEPGLFVADGGAETNVATGRIDIVARDAAGRLVAIELKAGKCPAGALEQVLAYAYDLSIERDEPVRAMLIAGSFSDRTRAAARRASDVVLKSYTYNLLFNSAE